MEKPPRVRIAAFGFGWLFGGGQVIAERIWGIPVWLAFGSALAGALIVVFSIPPEWRRARTTAWVALSVAITFLGMSYRDKARSDAEAVQVSDYCHDLNQLVARGETIMDLLARGDSKSAMIRYPGWMNELSDKLNYYDKPMAKRFADMISAEPKFNIVQDPSVVEKQVALLTDARNEKCQR